MRATWLIASVLLALPSVVSAEGPPPPEGKFRQQPPPADQPDRLMSPARRIESSVPGTIEVRRGEKVSFRGAGQCALLDPSVATQSVNEEGILTVKGLKEGKTEIYMFGKHSKKKKPPTMNELKNPRKIKVQVVKR